jgi:hypothetical protein
VYALLKVIFEFIIIVVVVVNIIIIIFLHGLGRLTCSGVDALPSFPVATTISSCSRFVVEGVFREFGVVHSFKIVDSILFVLKKLLISGRMFIQTSFLLLFERLTLYVCPRI